MDPVIGSLLVAGGQAGAGILSGALERRSRKKMAEYGYKKDLEMWKRQNVYNLPSAQMARLKQAGLNPNLVYGTGTVTGNVSTQLPKYQQPQLDYQFKSPEVANTLQQYSSYAMQQAQTKNIDADTISKLVEARVNASTLPEQIVERHQKAAEQTHITRLKELQRYQEVRREPYYKQKAEAEIVRYQAAAKGEEQRVTLRGMEIELYKILKTVGAGSQAGQLVNALLRTLMFKR